MLVVQCKDCRKEITSHPSRSQSCGCPNMMTVKGDSVTAVDLGSVLMIQSSKGKKEDNVLSPQDLSFQEERRKRKVRKLDFEIR
jgi:hypothetical protein